MEWTYKGYMCRLKPTPYLDDVALCPANGSYNGYARLPLGTNVTDRELEDIEVHGGVTYHCKESDGHYWVGWDDCHANPCPRPAKEETERLVDELIYLYESRKEDTKEEYIVGREFRSSQLLALGNFLDSWMDKNFVLDGFGLGDNVCKDIMLKAFCWDVCHELDDFRGVSSVDLYRLVETLVKRGDKT